MACPTRWTGCGWATDKSLRLALLHVARAKCFNSSLRAQAKRFKGAKKLDSSRCSLQRREIAKEIPMSYVAGFIVVVPTTNLAAYRRMATNTGTRWREHR